jgi:hypothetical protein
MSDGLRRTGTKYAGDYIPNLLAKAREEGRRQGRAERRLTERDPSDDDGPYGGLEDGALRGLLYARDETIASLSARVRRMSARWWCTRCVAVVGVRS